MNKNFEAKVSRRCFLGESGKLIGLGAFAHFMLVGNANANNFDRMKALTNCGRNEDNSCDPKSGGYKCGTPGSHSCASGGIFECNENANKCNLNSGHHAE